MGDRSLFYQEEPCRLLGNQSEPCKPSSHLQHIPNTDFSLHLLRKGVMGAGETIQSYNHQKRDFHHRNVSIDEDNIDVVNDNDKEQGETG